MEFILEEGKCLHEECSTLILPALSIGNVGHLAVDVLVETLEAERAGYLDTPFVLPCVGNDAYGPVPKSDLAFPIEAYDSPSNISTLLQQRSPVDKGMMIEFAKSLAGFSVSTGKEHVAVLSSIDFGRWQSNDMSSYLFILDRTNWRTNILTALLIPYIFLTLSSMIFNLLRGEVGKWIALIAVVLRLFFPRQFPAGNACCFDSSGSSCSKFISMHNKE